MELGGSVTVSMMVAADRGAPRAVVSFTGRFDRKRVQQLQREVLK